MAHSSDVHPELLARGEALARWRKQRNLSQAELGRFLGVSRVGIGYWEQGRTRMPVQLVRLALAHWDCMHRFPIGDLTWGVRINFRC